MTPITDYEIIKVIFLRLIKEDTVNHSEKTVIGCFTFSNIFSFEHYNKNNRKSPSVIDSSHIIIMKTVYQILALKQFQKFYIPLSNRINKVYSSVIKSMLLKYENLR